MERIRVNRASNLGPGRVRTTNSGESRFHAGHDIYAPAGTAVVSVIKGVVIKAGTSPSYGNYVTVKHEVTERQVVDYTVDPSDPDMVPIPVYQDVVIATYYSFYAHLDDVNVETGDQVEMGQQLGTVGTTGNARNLSGNNVHLHFEFGTELRTSGNTNMISSSSTLDPNTAYKRVRFDSDNPNGSQGSSGVIKSYLYNGEAFMKVHQKFKSTSEVGQDVIIENNAIDMINEAGGVSGDNGFQP